MHPQIQYSITIAALVALASACRLPTEATPCETDQHCSKSSRCDTFYGYCVAVDGGTGDAGPCGRTSVFVESFDDATPWGWQFEPSGTAAAISGAGHLLLRVDQGAPPHSYATFHSMAPAELRDDNVTIELESMFETDALATFALWLRTSPDLNHDELVLSVSNGLLYHWARAGDASLVSGNQPYSFSAHRFWRIEERSGTVSFLTSADGKSWDTIESLATPIADPIHVVIGLYANATTTATHQVRLAGVNTDRPRARFCPLRSLQDDFSNLGFPAWNPTTGAVCSYSVFGSAVTMTTMQSSGQCHFESKHAYDLTGGSAAIELAPPTEWPDDLWVYLELISDPRSVPNALAIGSESGALISQLHPAASALGPVGLGAYAETDRYWRIREAKGTVYFETSADGVVYQERDARTPPFPVTSLKVRFGIDADSANLPPPPGIDFQFLGFNVP